MKTNKEHIEFTDLVVKFLSGGATAEETEKLQEMKSADKALEEIYQEYNQLWDSIGVARDIDDINVDDEWNVFQEKLSNSGNKDAKVVRMKGASLTNRARLFRYAAIFILGLIVAGGIFTWNSVERYTTVISGSNPQDYDLPDGSEITLNSESKIKHPKKFIAGNSRKVKLEGEAHFDVKPDKSKPFVIDIGEVFVEVKGTSFYINAGAHEQYVEVIVESGKVAVGKVAEPETIYLEAGEKALFSKKDHSLIKTVNKDANYLAWKTKKLKFKKEKLSAIVEDINDLYQSHIVIKGESIQDCRLTLTFDNLPLDTVIEILQTTLDLEIEKNNSTIELNGQGC